MLQNLDQLDDVVLFHADFFREGFFAGLERFEGVLELLLAANLIILIAVFLVDLETLLFEEEFGVLSFYLIELLLSRLQLSLIFFNLALNIEIIRDILHAKLHHIIRLLGGEPVFPDDHETAFVDGLGALAVSEPPVRGSVVLQIFLVLVAREKLELFLLELELFSLVHVFELSDFAVLLKSLALDLEDLVLPLDLPASEAVVLMLDLA